MDNSARLSERADGGGDDRHHADQQERGQEAADQRQNRAHTDRSGSGFSLGASSGTGFSGMNAQDLGNRGTRVCAAGQVACGMTPDRVTVQRRPGLRVRATDVEVSQDSPQDRCTGLGREFRDRSVDDWLASAGGSLSRALVGKLAPVVLCLLYTSPSPRD